MSLKPLPTDATVTAETNARRRLRGKPASVLATGTGHRQASVGMDCDDCILLMAHPGQPSEEVATHLASCNSCRSLAEHLEADDDLSTADGSLGSESPDDLIGTVIGAYQIRELVGSGGMGRVYVAVHPAIGSRVAIKVFSKDWNEHPALVARFFAEAHATNVIAHENIVNVLDVGRLDDGRPFLIMEYLLGVPLSKLVGSVALSDGALTRILLDVLGALAAAHQHEIVHRDLKPDNIFVSPEGRATLLDFGIAKLLPEIGGDSAPTVTGTVIGTPHYMSPEQAVGDPVDTRTDVYAMGVILYECFTGKRPFSGTSLYRLMDQHVNRTPTAPRILRPDLGEDVEAIILKALSKLPEDRFATTGEMRDALAACACSTAAAAFSLDEATKQRKRAHVDTPATIASRPKPREAPAEPSSARGQRRSAITWAVLAVVLVAGLGIGIVLISEKPAARVATTQDASPLIATDGRLTEALANAVDTPVVADASPADAAVVDVSSGPIRPSPGTRIRPRQALGLAPLSLLGAATELALDNKPDAILIGVRLQGLNREGLVQLGKGTNAVSFDYLSPSMAAHIASRGRERGVCIVRVEYREQSQPVVQQVGGTCASKRPLPTPRCSLKRVMREAIKGGTLPKDGEVRSAALIMSSSRKSRRAFWKFTIGDRSFDTPSC